MIIISQDGYKQNPLCCDEKMYACGGLLGKYGQEEYAYRCHTCKQEIRFKVDRKPSEKKTYLFENNREIHICHKKSIYRCEKCNTTDTYVDIYQHDSGKNFSIVSIYCQKCNHIFCPEKSEFKDGDL